MTASRGMHSPHHEETGEDIHRGCRIRSDDAEIGIKYSIGNEQKKRRTWSVEINKENNDMRLTNKRREHETIEPM